MFVDAGPHVWAGSESEVETMNCCWLIALNQNQIRDITESSISEHLKYKMVAGRSLSLPTSLPPQSFDRICP